MSIARIEASKQTRLLATLKWVDDNYEWADGVCLPRCVLYHHYQEFCQAQGFLCVGPATFGKIIRQRFPKLTTRRLGTRGQSRYHYYGIGIKEESPYYRQTCNGKRLSRFSGTGLKTEEDIKQQSRKRFSLHSKSGTLLPEFPTFEDLTIPSPWKLDDESLKTIMVMYRAHCQRILDTVISADFEEVQNLFLHFWQGMPVHLKPTIHNEQLAHIVAACDVILYKTINEVLIPSRVQEIPESLCFAIKSFVRNLPRWLESSLEGCPYVLKQRKMKVVNWFVILIRRQLSFIHLACITRVILVNAQTIAQDLMSLEMSAIVAQMSTLMKTSYHSGCAELMSNKYQSLVVLLMKQGTLEDSLSWMDDVIDSYLSEICQHRLRHSDGSAPSTTDIHYFVLPWSYFLSLVVRELTVQDSVNFGSVHVMHLMFKEYIHMFLETQRIKQLMERLQTQLSKCLKTDAKFNVKSVNLEVDSCLVSDSSSSSGRDKLHTTDCFSTTTNICSLWTTDSGRLSTIQMGPEECNFDDKLLMPYVDTIPHLNEPFQCHASMFTHEGSYANSFQQIDCFPATEQTEKLCPMTILSTDPPSDYEIVRCNYHRLPKSNNNYAISSISTHT